MEKGNKLIMIVIIALLVILLAAISVLAFFGVRMLGEMKAGIEGEIPNSPSAPVVGILTQSDLTSIDLETKTTNLKRGESGRSHAIRIRISVNIDNTHEESEALIALMTERVSALEDGLLEICGSMTFEELSDGNGYNILREQLLQLYREIFNTSLIHSINIVERTIT